MVGRKWRGATACAWALAPMFMFTLVFGGANAHAQEARVSLREVLAHADTHAPALVVARARLEEGVGARRAADRLLSAPLSVELGGGPRFGSESGEDFDLLFTITQPIEVASERGARRGAADGLSRRRDAELEAARWQVHRDVHYGFHRAIEARLRVEAAERRRELAEHLVDIARRRRDAGDIPDLDVTMAAAELASARQELVRARGAYTQASLTLAELSGWPAHAPPAPAGGLDQPTALAEDATLVARALDGHPVLRALDAAVSEQEARVRLADTQAFPTLDLGVSFAREGSAGSPANYIGLLVAGAAIPIWDQNSEARAQSRAARSVAEAERDALRSVIAARVLRAAATLRASRERIEIFVRDVLPGFDTSLELLERGFELGELDALEVAAATRRVLEVQSNALDAFAEYHSALAELEAEVGSEVVADHAHENDEGGAR